MISFIGMEKMHCKRGHEKYGIRQEEGRVHEVGEKVIYIQVIGSWIQFNEGLLWVNAVGKRDMNIYHST